MRLQQSHLGIFRPALTAAEMAVTPSDPFYVLYDPAFPPDYLFTYSGMMTADAPDGLYQSTNDELARRRVVATRSQQGFQSLPNASDVYEDWARTVEADSAKYTDDAYRARFAQSWANQGATPAMITNAFTYVPTFISNPPVIVAPPDTVNPPPPGNTGIVYPPPPVQSKSGGTAAILGVVALLGLLS